MLAAMPLQAHAAMSVVSDVPVSWGPAAFAVNPVTNLVYAGSVTDDASHGIVSQVQIIAGTQVVASIKRAGLNPVGLGMDVAGARLLVSSFNSNKVFVYNAVSNSLAAQIAVTSPWGIDVDQQTGRAFVAGFSSKILTIIDRSNTTTWTDLAPAGCVGPVGVAFNSAHAEVFVSCLYSGNVVVVSSVTGAVIKTIDTGGLGAYSWGIASESTGDLIYLANWLGGSKTAGTVVVISAATNDIVTTAYVGGAPIGVTVSPLGTPYVTLSAVNKLAALKAGTGLTDATLDLPVDPADGKNEPHAAIVHPSGRLVYVGNFHAESVSIVNTLSYQ